MSEADSSSEVKRRPSTVRLKVRTKAADEEMEAAQNRRPAVFLDRDGTLMEEKEYCANPEDVEIISGAGSALRALKNAGFHLIIITNQSGIGRGMFSESEFREVQAELLRKLGKNLIDATYHCPSAPEKGDPRRKPSPLMVEEAVRDFNVDAKRSYFVGDKPSDIECGRNAGLSTVRVKTGYGKDAAEGDADFVVADIVEATRIILARAHG